MVIPFLSTRQGWQRASYLHPSLEPVLAETGGVVVFHEQIIGIIAIVTGCTLAQGDEARRALGTPHGQADVKRWFVPAATRKGYDDATIARIWFVLESFASFGFCKAHAAAFALPTYQSAWLKTHYPAHFLSGVLTHDPGMYPKRLMLEEARRLGVLVLGLDVNRSDACYRVEKLDGPPPEPGAGLPDGRGYGIRLALADVKGISATRDRARRAGASLRVADRLLAPRRRGHAGPGGARAGRSLRRAVRHRRRPDAAPRAHHPPRPAAQRRRPRDGPTGSIAAAAGHGGCAPPTTGPARCSCRSTSPDRPTSATWWPPACRNSPRPSAWLQSSRSSASTPAGTCCRTTSTSSLPSG